MTDDLVKAPREELRAMPKAGWPCAECAFGLPWLTDHPRKHGWWGQCSWRALPLTLAGLPRPFVQIPATLVDGPEDATKKVCPQFQRKAPQ